MDRFRYFCSLLLITALLVSLATPAAGTQTELPPQETSAQSAGEPTQAPETEPTREPEETEPTQAPQQSETRQEQTPESPETEPPETKPPETEPPETEPPETEPPETEPPETEPQKPESPVNYNPVPLFFQTDYPDTRYGYGTVASSGCSITCVSMVAGYLTGHIYLPDQLAKWFGGKAENNMARLEYAARMLQLPFEESYTVLDIFAALEQGKVAIVLMNSDSDFTDSQHFIVLCGLTDDGKILVNDPYKPNYEDWRLQEGFQNGFDREDIICGYYGGWIFDKSAMPQDPFIYYEPPRDLSNPRYPWISLSDKDLDLLAKVIWVEAQGECFEGQQAVAEVVLNRMASDKFPDDLHSIIYGEEQFRSVPYLRKAKPNQTQYDAIEAALYGPYILPENVYYFARQPENEHIWGTIGGHVFCYG